MLFFCDEMGQVPSEILATIDIILRRVRDSNIYLGGVLMIFTMDHTQIQPIGGRPILTSCHIITCFKMVALKHSVRASGDEVFTRIQKIARYTYRTFEEKPELIDEFISLCSDNFTFVDDWDDDGIPASTMRLYSKKVPAKDAAKQFVERVRRQVNELDRKEKKAENVQKSRYSHQDWNLASQNTSSKLEQKLKEPTELLFFKALFMNVLSMLKVNLVTHKQCYYSTYLLKMILTIGAR